MCSSLSKMSFALIAASILFIESSFAQTDSSLNTRYLGNHSDDVEALSLPSNNRFIVSGGWDKAIQVFYVDSNFTHMQTLSGHRSAVSALSFNKDATAFVSGGKDYKVLVWRLNPYIDSFMLEAQISNVHSAGINAVLYAPTGSMVYTGGDDGKILIYNVLKESSKVIDNESPVHGIAMGSNRRYLYCVDATPIVKVYDVGGSLFKSYEGHSDEVNAIAISANNQFFVTGSSDKTAIIWNLVTGKKKFTLVGHEWKVTSLTISADNKYVVTGSNDGSVKIWDAEKGTLVQSFNDLGKNIRSVALSKDMTTIFIALHLPEGSNESGVMVINSGIQREVPMLPGQKGKNVGEVPDHLKKYLPANSQGSGQTKTVTQSPSSNPSKPKPQNDKKKEVIKQTDEVIITVEDQD
jgi:WD40 repeat protein